MVEKPAAENAGSTYLTKEHDDCTTISPEALLSITRMTTLNVPGVSRMNSVPGGVNRFLLRGASEGLRLQVKDDYVIADLYIVACNDVNFQEVSHKIQLQVKRAITEMVGMQVTQVNIHIEDVDFPEENEA
jgi:uncharacterized alkaline shock family protein YloU